MKQILKKTGYALMPVAFILVFHSCKNNSSSSANNSDSTATTVTVHDTVRVPDTSAATKQQSPDARFVIDAAKSNSEEMQMLEAGDEQGSNKKLKTTAKKMFTDHQKLGQQLLDYATRKNITLSSDTSVDMSAMNGDNEATFDTAWTQKMIDGHQQMIVKFENGQSTVSDPDLKTLISNALPTLHNHLEMCQSLMTVLKK